MHLKNFPTPEELIYDVDHNVVDLVVGKNIENQITALTF